ncbi:ABC transporter permease [Alicyclobacillus herbarius]|uniref:ABC transporter permease n=1 Tax=Alicyclobacillus herbarius TaxID=122960 RepID=UPI0012DCFBC7|nr:ABC-2 family transporter protein [Alicyclobacillus herbarius]
MRSIFLVVIMYVFSELWSTTYAAGGRPTIAGYSVNQMVWYLAFTESIVMGCPHIMQRLAEEIKHGDIAYRLTKPIGYIGYNFAHYLGEASIRIFVNFILAGIVTTFFFGPPPVTWGSLGCGLGVTAVAVSTQFALNMTLGLLLFWMEDGRGLDLILSRLVMILGGMMIPLPLFPTWLAHFCAWLPFQVVAYLPARTLVHAPGYNLGQGVGLAVGWMLLCFVLCGLLYRQGVRRLYVQGG